MQKCCGHIRIKTKLGSNLQVGLEGERKQVFSEEGSKNVLWAPAPNGNGGALTWYKVLNPPTRIYGFCSPDSFSFA